MLGVRPLGGYYEIKGFYRYFLSVPIDSFR